VSGITKKEKKGEEEQEEGNVLLERLFLAS
jgi:hypothetical protein